MPATETHCPYCALQCGMLLHTTDQPATVTVSPTPGGGLCQKGWNAAALLHHPQRITTPLLRTSRTEPLRPVTWDTAITAITTRLNALRTRHGPDSVAVFGGGGLTNEKAYALGKFARVTLGTRMIDYNGRFCMSAAAAAGNRAFGLDRGLPFPLGDLADADVIMLVGANTAETMPPLLRHLDTQRRNGGTLIVIDPRATPTATAADIHLQPTLGTDLAIANALLHQLIADNRVDHRYLATRTTGYDQVKATVAEYWPERVERITGVSTTELRSTATALANARRLIILTGRGAEQHANGTDTVTAYINLALALGAVGTPGSGYGCITGQGNGQGGREHGQKADQLPGYRRIDDPAARAAVASVWGIDPATLPGPGISATELFAAMGTPTGPKALLVFGANPVVSAPDASTVTRNMAALDLLVVADFVESETAAMADVVLPTAQWAEEEGTMTNLEGRVLRRRAIGQPPPGVRTDLQILATLSDHLGAPGAIDPDPEATFTELRRATAGAPADYAGITYQRLDTGQHLHWPVPDEQHNGTPRLFTERFATPDGRARMIPVDQPEPTEPPCQQYPLRCTTGRVLAQYQSGAQTRRIRQLATDPYVELHPDTAADLGIEQGTPVRVRSRRGELVAPARISETIRPDTVFIPFHWPGAARANTLTTDTLDPIARMPQFKACAVAVGPA